MLDGNSLGTVHSYYLQNLNSTNCCTHAQILLWPIVIQSRNYSTKQKLSNNQKLSNCRLVLVTQLLSLISYLNVFYLRISNDLLCAKEFLTI